MLYSITALVALQIIHIQSKVVCPDSDGDSKYWSGPDVGVNIWSHSSSRAEDCFLRHSQLHPQTSIDNEWIDPSLNLMVLAHGWSESARDHLVSDQWNNVVSWGCVSGANDGDVEECQPDDHDSQFWMDEGWNVVYLDWRSYADFLDVHDAEERIYVDVTGNNETVQIHFFLMIQRIFNLCT